MVVGLTVGPLVGSIAGEIVGFIDGDKVSLTAVGARDGFSVGFDVGCCDFNGSNLASVMFIEGVVEMILPYDGRINIADENKNRTNAKAIVLLGGEYRFF